MKRQLMLTFGYIINMIILLMYGDLPTYGNVLLFFGLAFCFAIDYLAYKSKQTTNP